MIVSTTNVPSTISATTTQNPTLSTTIPVPPIDSAPPRIPCRSLRRRPPCFDDVVPLPRVGNAALEAKDHHFRPFRDLCAVGRSRRHALPGAALRVDDLAGAVGRDRDRHA